MTTKQKSFSRNRMPSTADICMNKDLYRRGEIAGEMTQWLRALAVLAEDLNLVPSTTQGGSQPPVTQSLGGMHMCGCVHTHANMGPRTMSGAPM